MKNENYFTDKNVIVFYHSAPQIGYFARTSTKGPELDMVNSYVSFLIEKYKKLKNKKAAIFIEPQLDTGYPDIVIAEYSSFPSLMWTDERNSLGVQDIKLLYYIQTNGKNSVENISNILGFELSEIKKSIIKLNRLGLIQLSKNHKYVRNVRLSSYCRINKIVAIEAKMDKWKEAIRQASNNIWFANESYVLMNKDRCSKQIIQLCQSKGVGIILINGKVMTKLKCPKRNFPVSYASLQFNEWILRNRYLGG